LSGGIPPELGGLTSVQSLLLAHNRLSGSIPAELGDLTTLDGLWLHNNNLTGSIPLELGYLTGLRYLLLDHNRLTGDVPPELINLTALLNGIGLRLCLNELTTNDKTLSGFLDIKHSDMGSWQGCQALFWDDFESSDTSMW
jgi:Leucine-rich repeat (LRR) protein